jgi:hypothetical protein
MDPHPLVSAIVQQTHAPVHIYLGQTTSTRDPLLLPSLINVLDDLVQFLQQTLRGHISHQSYRNHIQSTVGLQDRLTAYQRSLSTSFGTVTPTTIVSGAQGRPAFAISSAQLEFLTTLGYSDTEIAASLGTSRQTITRRRREYGQQRRQLKHLVPQQHLEAVSCQNWALHDDF